MNPLYLGAVDSIGSDTRRLVIMAFLVFIGLSVLWLFSLAVSEEDTVEGLYVANRSLSPAFNGFALAGEHISVLTLLGTPGLIALFGYDGFTFAIDILLTLGVLLLLAPRIRNSNSITLGDIFSLRSSGTGVRIAANLVTLAITIPILMVQLRAAGTSTAFLIGLPNSEVQIVCTVLMGALVTCFASMGSLRGTSFVHIVKVPLALLALAAIVVLSLKRFHWSPEELLSKAVKRSTAPDQYLSPGLWRFTESFGGLNTLSTHVVVILGAAMMPHLLLRVSASRSGSSARRSVTIAVGLIGVFLLLLIAAGFSATAVVRGTNIAAVDGAGQASLISLAADVLDDGSTMRVAVITGLACVVFLTVLTTVTSVTFAAAASLARDIHAHAAEPRFKATEEGVVRGAAAVVGIIGIMLAAATYQYPTEFLATFSLCVAASCIFPSLIYTFFWRRFNQRGLLWSVYGGLLTCVTLTVFSPTVSGTPFALWPEENFDWYPLQTPGLVSIPVALLLGWIGSITSADRTGTDFRHVEYELLTGDEIKHPAGSRRS